MTFSRDEEGITVLITTQNWFGWDDFFEGRLVTERMVEKSIAITLFLDSLIRPQNLTYSTALMVCYFTLNYQ